MPKYNFEAFDKFGHVCKGEIEANSKEEAIGKLREGEIRDTPLFIQNIEEDSTPFKAVLPIPEPPRRIVPENEEGETVVIDPNPPKPQPQAVPPSKPTPEEIAAIAKQREEAVKKAAEAAKNIVRAEGPPAPPPEPEPVTADELIDFSRRVMAMKYPEGLIGDLGPAIKTWDYSKIAIAQSALFLAAAMTGREKPFGSSFSLGSMVDQEGPRQ